MKKLSIAVLLALVFGISSCNNADKSNNVNESKSITQFGITWTFDKEYPVGKFANGDYWVVGPVKVVSVSPGPQQADSINENIRITFVKNDHNQYGDTDVRDDRRMRNGSMVNPVWSKKHGYDSGSATYDESLSIKFPYNLKANESLVSTVSNTSMPNELLLPMGNQISKSVLNTAAILTCLEKAPEELSFRPSYAGSTKKTHTVNEINWDKLPSLEPVEATPTIAEVSRYVERPWLDHVDSWMSRSTAPTANMSDYGREYVRMVSLVSMRLMLNDSKEDKKELLYRFIQLGIDLQGIRETGAKWHWGGGLASGRKWPIMFAGIMLNDKEMQTFSSESAFHEDQQTYYGKGWTGETALWQMIQHHGLAPLFEEMHPSEWTKENKGALAHGYRVCCNGTAWGGEALSALLMNAKQMWNHDAFFDYTDRYMSETPDKYIEAGLKVSEKYRKELWTRNVDVFVDNMWRKYRTTVAKQPGAVENKKWLPLERKWVIDNGLDKVKK
ncbi:MAG: hypothetical protein ABFR62_13120 [Bacteroidota bacterium]